VVHNCVTSLYISKHTVRWHLQYSSSPSILRYFYNVREFYYHMNGIKLLR